MVTARVIFAAPVRRGIAVLLLLTGVVRNAQRPSEIGSGGRGGFCLLLHRSAGHPAHGSWRARLEQAGTLCSGTAATGSGVRSAVVAAMQGQKGMVGDGGNVQREGRLTEH